MLFAHRMRRLYAYGLFVLVGVTNVQAQLLPQGLSRAEWLQIQQQIVQQGSLNSVDDGAKGDQARGDQAKDDREGTRGTVDDPNAVFSQTNYIKPSHVGQSDLFTHSLALSGDTLVVGVPNEDSVSTGTAGDPANNSRTDSGAVYVFVRNGGVWMQQAFLKASNADASDQFGWAVDISGNTIVVGARLEDSLTTGINPAQNNNGVDVGAAYIFIRQGTTWSQQAFLKAHSVDHYDYFGYSVAISGSTVVVGSHGEDGAGDGINPSVNDSALNSGAAYVFTRSGTTWTQQAYIKSSSSDADDNFGYSVDIDGNNLIVGALNEDSSSTVVNGSQGNTTNGNFGAAYVFSRNNGVWTQRSYLKAPNAGLSDNFGVSVSIRGDVAVVGAHAEDSSAQGVNGAQADDSAANAGAAYVFRRNQNNNWYFSQYLKATNTGANDQFGISVDVSNAYIAVGAHLEDSSVGGVDNPSNNSAGDAGAAYLFSLDSAGVAISLAYLKPRYPQGGDQFGVTVALGDRLAAIGARYEDSSATGINGNEQNNSVTDAGALFTFSPTSTYYTVGGAVFGLSPGNELVLTNNDVETVTITANGIFRFPSFYLNGEAYNVTVQQQPNMPVQDCTISGGTGTIIGVGVDSIQIDCYQRTLFIPTLIDAIDTGIVEVPIYFAPNTGHYSGVSFSLDYDENCLNPDQDGDGLLDDAAISISTDFTSLVNFDANDTDGEIDISIFDPAPPFASLPNTELARISFLTNCVAAQQSSPYTNTIAFSSEPAPSFTDDTANSTAGTAADGSVRVWSGGVGDCNVDDNVANSDLLALGVEIFDGDGENAIEAPAQGFTGSPIGCDANADTIISVADVSCINRLIFNDECGTQRISQSLKPELSVVLVTESERLWLETRLQTKDQDVSGISYTLTLDPNIFDLSLFDLNYDGVPDTIEYPQGTPFLAPVTWLLEDGQALLNVLISASPGNTLADGTVLRIGIPTAQAAVGGLKFADRSPVRFASLDGADITGLAFIGDEILSDSWE